MKPLYIKTPMKQYKSAKDVVRPKKTSKTAQKASEWLTRAFLFCKQHRWIDGTIQIFLIWFGTYHIVLFVDPVTRFSNEPVAVIIATIVTWYNLSRIRWS